uniref:Major facilitator superfamily (MFS) profile domain-containing protein n=1 Tax=Bionectria ochroleuca TaxID=29856 RepID=A0A0B7KJV9_BIOOC
MEDMKPHYEIRENVTPNSNSLSLTTPYMIDPQVERQLIRKLDRHIIPTVMFAYLLCFLDRTNIGNARLFGLEADLHMSGDMYQVAVAVLFIPYILVEIPSNLVIKRFRPSRWLAFITVSWGIVSTLTGIVQNYAGLIACRLLLGLLEGGLLPGLTVYLTVFYTKKEMALRFSYLFVATALAGACGGLLAYGIGFMDGVNGLSGWRWVFIIEGIPTVLFGFVIYFVLADNPETASYVTEEERQLLLRRLQNQTGFHEEFDKKDAWMAVKDWKTWVFSGAEFCTTTMLYSYSVFLPSIIQGLNPRWTRPEIQALTIPCYAVGAVSYYTVAWLSDRHQLRGPYLVVCNAICMLGYGLSLLPESAGVPVHYFATFLVAIGLFVGVGLPLSWLPTNNPRYGKRTTATAIQISICNCSGVMAPFLYPLKDSPRYVKGYAVSIGLLAVGMTTFGSLSYYLHTVNQRRRAGKEDYKIEGMSDAEIDALGDKSPRFMYTI